MHRNGRAWAAGVAVSVTAAASAAAWWQPVCLLRRSSGTAVMRLLVAFGGIPGVHCMPLNAMKSGLGVGQEFGQECVVTWRGMLRPLSLFLQLSHFGIIHHAAWRFASVLDISHVSVHTDCMLGVDWWWCRLSALR